ncbi:signal recognition particle protein [Chondrinema litorale]|uniref:signal recognition particle protein n=1 Tax=Chondrinema litorale TaxID=2994555 RepID=UPI0025444DA6|nr:signal recognition particle protein [Chondrinema litorale]UZR93113.1 signal recognition particle protein [Chondrinema litorale]
MFENLSNRLDQAMKTLKGQGRITEINVANTVKEIRRALLEADVNYRIAKDITNEIKEEALGQKVLTAVSPGQLLIKIVNDKLCELMGGSAAPFNPKGNPGVVLIAGLQGSGKTTFTSKISNLLKKQGNQVLMAACDIYRPAAIDQLKTLGEQIGVEVYAEPENKNAVEIAQNALKHAKANGKNIVIVDTAGRLAVDEQMMEEITKVKAALNPQETLFVVDSMTGQDAVNTAQAFNEKLDFDGVVLTKLDGDTRGGAALSIRSVVSKPIKFISTGEKADTIDTFYPERMANRILGMGDVVSLVEKAQEVFDEQEAKRLNKKLRKNQFDLNDMLSQIQQIKKMGNLKDLMGMIPGMGKMVKDADIDDDSFKPIEAIIFSMTPKERESPTIIDAKRKKRIANGSGTSVQQVNNLLKQYEEMKKMIKKVNKMSGKGQLRNLFG